MNVLNQSVLEGNWLHSHEESKGETLVFRRSGYTFPAGTIRTGISLDRSGQLRLLYPTKTTNDLLGSWSTNGTKLMIKAPLWDGKFEIQSATRNRLTIRAKPKPVVLLECGE